MVAIEPWHSMCVSHDWPQLGQNARKTAFIPQAILVSGGLATTDALYIGGSASDPVVSDSMVLFVTSRDILKAHELGTGATAWQAPLRSADVPRQPGDDFSVPAVSGGVAFVGCREHAVHAFDVKTGTPLWTTDTAGAVQSSPTAHGSRVFVGCDDGNLYGLDAHTGDVRWTAPTGGRVRSSPAIGDRVVYVTSTSGMAHAIDVVTGTRLWPAVTGDAIEASPCLADGALYIGSWDARLYALDATSGERLWRRQLPDSLDKEMALAPGVLLVSVNDEVYAIETKDGKARWKRKLPESAGAPTAAGNVAFVGSYQSGKAGALYALRLTDGKVLAKVRLAEEGPGGAVVPAAEKVFAMTSRWLRVFASEPL